MRKRRYIATVVMGVGALGALPAPEASAAVDQAPGKPSATQSQLTGHESPSRHSSRIRVADGDDGGDDDGSRRHRDGGDDDGGRRGHDGHDDDNHRKRDSDGDD